MDDEPFVIMTLQCPRCKTKQSDEVACLNGLTQMVKQTILFLNCDNNFMVTLPNKVLRGPFRV